MLLTQSANLNEIEAAANLLLTAYRAELERAIFTTTAAQAEQVIDQLELVLQDVASTRHYESKQEASANA